MVNKRDFKVNLEENVFKFESSLKNEAVTKKPLLICQLCPKSFKFPSEIKKHVEVDAVHKGLKNYKCEICFKTFAAKGNYSMHVDRVHKNIKPFECDKCTLAFPQKCFLTSHILAKHENEISKVSFKSNCNVKVKLCMCF